MANSVTGAASLFRRDLLDYALPFPPRQFTHFHDHWIGLIARRRSATMAFVERPLYDYVQHGNAVLGHAAANRMPTLRDRLGWLEKDPRDRVRRWRLHYFVDCCRLMQFTTILEMRCGPRDDAPPGVARSTLPERRALAAGARPISPGARARAASASRRHWARRWRSSSPSPGDGSWSPRPADSSGRAAACGSTRGRRRRSCRCRAGRRSQQRRGRHGRRQDRSARAGRPRGRAAAGQHPDPDDRPRAFLRGLHHQAEPRPAAGRAGRTRPHRHGRPGRGAARRPGAASSSRTAGSRACSSASRWSSAASRRASR